MGIANQKKNSALEAHIVEELTAWTSNISDNPRWDLKKYDNPHVEFGSKNEISCGEIIRVEIHVGNKTEAYSEERRFRPTKLLILGVPNPAKKYYPRDDCNHVDFHTTALYQHPDGTWYSGTSVCTHDKNEKELAVRVPVPYQVKDLLPVPKANKLLERNPAVLKEITDRITALEMMRDKISRKK